MCVCVCVACVRVCYEEHTDNDFLPTVPGPCVQLSWRHNDQHVDHSLLEFRTVQRPGDRMMVKKDEKKKPVRGTISSLFSSVWGRPSTSPPVC